MALAVDNFVDDAPICVRFMDHRARRSSGSSWSSTSSDAFPSFEGIAPPRAATTAPDEETRVAVADFSVRLKVDAGPGCGGIAWPAGEVSSCFCGAHATLTLLGTLEVSRIQARARTGALGWQDCARAREWDGAGWHSCWAAGAIGGRLGH